MLQVAAGHLRIGVDAAAGEAPLLDGAGGADPRGDRRRGLSFPPVDQCGGRDRPDPQLDIDPVHDRAGEFRQVQGALGNRTGAAVAFPVVSAGAGIGGRDEHEGSGIDDLGLQAGNRDFPVLQRPPEGLQRGFRRLAELVGKEHAARGEGDLPGEDVLAAAAAEDGGLGGGNVRGAEGASPQEAELSAAPSRDRIDLRSDQRFRPRHGWQDTGDGLGH